MHTREELRVKEYVYPFADRVNPVLYKIVKQRYNNDPVHGGAQRTNADLHQQGIKEVDNLIQWVGNLIPDFAADIVGGKMLSIHPKLGGLGGFSIHEYSIDSCWGIIYNKGNSVVKHNHFPYNFSFCYYVNIPSHSSPLILEGKRMRMKEGHLIIFLSHYNHWVPKNKIDGRCVVVGNISYSL